jgi:hypothetical protein
MPLSLERFEAEQSHGLIIIKHNDSRRHRYVSPPHDLPVEVN